MPSRLLIGGGWWSRKIRTMCAAVNSSPSHIRNQQHVTTNRSRDKSYDYLLKFLLVGDSDVGKEELLSGMDDGASESPYGYASSGMWILENVILLISVPTYILNSKCLMDLFRLAGCSFSSRGEGTFLIIQLLFSFP